MQFLGGGLSTADCVVLMILQQFLGGGLSTADRVVLTILQQFLGGGLSTADRIVLRIFLGGGLSRWQASSGFFFRVGISLARIGLFGDAGLYLLVFAMEKKKLTWSA